MTDATSVEIIRTIAAPVAKVFAAWTDAATLRLWLQVWEAPTGHLLWERTGELTVSVPVVQQDRMMSLDELAQKLWARMREKDLFQGLPLSASCTSATAERTLGPSPARAKPMLTNSTAASAPMATIFSSE